MDTPETVVHLVTGGHPGTEARLETGGRPFGGRSARTVPVEVVHSVPFG